MRVPKISGGISPAEHAAAAGGDSPKPGEFEELLVDKQSKQGGGGRPEPRRPERHRTGGRLSPGVPGPAASRPPERRGTGPDAARAPDKAGGGGPEGSGRDGASGLPVGLREMPARDAAAHEALRRADPELQGSSPRGELGVPGALTAPVHSRWEPPAAGALATRSADAAARVERIAQQIVEAVEVRLHETGAVEARLELSLGSLGRMSVAVERTAEGRIRVALQPTSADTAGLLKTHGSELVRRLEARGLHIQELTVEASGETVLRIERAATEPVEAPTAPPLAEARSADPQPAPATPRHRERSDEDSERRGRSEPEPQEEDEDAG